MHEDWDTAVMFHHHVASMNTHNYHQSNMPKAANGTSTNPAQIAKRDKLVMQIKALKKYTDLDTHEKLRGHLVKTNPDENFRDCPKTGYCPSYLKSMPGVVNELSGPVDRLYKERYGKGVDTLFGPDGSFSLKIQDILGKAINPFLTGSPEEKAMIVKTILEQMPFKGQQVRGMLRCFVVVSHTHKSTLHFFDKRSNWST